MPLEKIEIFAGVVNEYVGVTHNYQRDDAYNVWFTFIGPSRRRIKEDLACIAAKTGVDQILNLPATQVFKIRAHFDL